jgi:multidrug transporter EmrE-like cation transporter
LAEQAGEHDVVVQDDAELDQAFAGGVRPIAGGEGLQATEVPVGQKRGRAMLIAFILVSVALAATAQLTLKHGMNQVTNHGEVPLELGRPLEVARRIVSNPSVWAGLATFVLSATVWLVVLSRASLSFAYPFVSLTYVLILLFDRFVLREPISGLRYAGVALIIGGLLLISRTHQTS